MHTSINAGEQTVARKLIRALLDRGFRVSVFGDGESDLWKSTDFKAIWDATGETGETDFRVYADTRFVGVVTLIWGNSPHELIADWADVVGSTDLTDLIEPIRAATPDPYATSRMERNISTGLL